jgi:tol-pal system protein YbgF
MKARLVLLLCVCSSACAEPVALPPVVDNSAYPAANVRPAKPPSTNTLFEIMGRLEQLQLEVQQLTGKVEEQAYQLTELKKRQNSMYTDFDDRIQGIDTKIETVKQSATGAAEVPAVVEPEPKPAEPSPTAPEAPATSAQPAPAEPTAKKVDAGSNAEKQSYQHAYDELRNGHNSQAITEFTAFLSEYPKGEFASNAQYWLGEAYKVNQEIDPARAAFKKVVDQYPGSAKVPDALLKLGYIEMDQKNSAKAREYLTRVTTDFSSSTAAHLAAKKLLLLDDVKN